MLTVQPSQTQPTTSADTGDPDQCVRTCEFHGRVNAIDSMIRRQREGIVATAMMRARRAAATVRYCAWALAIAIVSFGAVLTLPGPVSMRLNGAWSIVALAVVVVAMAAGIAGVTTGWNVRQAIRRLEVRVQQRELRRHLAGHGISVEEVSHSRI